MTQVSTGSHLRRYFSIEIMRASQRQSNIENPSVSWLFPSPKQIWHWGWQWYQKIYEKQSLTVRSKIPSSMKSHNIYKPAHRLTRQVSVPVLSKLISETNRWTGPCVIQFLLEGRSETMLHHWCGNGKYPTVLRFGIDESDARVPVRFHNWCVEVYWSVLWCADSSRDWCVFFILVQVRLCDVKKTT